MKQIAIIPSGSQIHYKGSILYFDENAFYYASTLAVYIYNSKTFVLEKILSLNQRAITSLCVCPLNLNLLAISGIDGSLSLWKVQEQEVINQLSILEGPSILCWDPKSLTHCAIVTKIPNLKLYYWDVYKTSINELLSINNREQSITAKIARWNPNENGQIAIGCSNSIVFVFNHISKVQISLRVKERSVPVVDMQWDRLSSIYLLVAYETFISLWDTQTAAEIHTFERQTAPITSIVWMDWTAGNFVSSNSKNGYLKVWNASQNLPLETIRIDSESNTGVNSMIFSNNNKRLLLAYFDGSTGIYHMERKQLEYRSSGGHTETIFDCKMCPASPNLFATASYDATVKIWNIGNLKLNQTLNGHASEIIYSCDWSADGSMIVASSALGYIFIWEVATGRELSKYIHHAKASYCVAWNKLNETVIASTSGDGTCTIFEVDKEILLKARPMMGNVKAKNDLLTYSTTRPEVKARLIHPGAVYGCAWHPFKLSILATCCLDGNVRVFDIDADNTLIYLLAGHTARAFSSVWSPISPGLLASGSDDHQIMLWDVELEKNAEHFKKKSENPIKISPRLILSGHKANVRALSWSYEHKHLLLSGSWDSTIRLWDVVSGACLMVVNDHVADVYSITSHPARPFTYVSCSRDTTIRVWELRGVFHRMRMNAVWDVNVERIIIENNSHLMLHQAPSDEDIHDASLSLSDGISEFMTTIPAYKLTWRLNPVLHGVHSKVLHTSLSSTIVRTDQYEIERIAPAKATAGMNSLNQAKDKMDPKDETPLLRTMRDSINSSSNINSGGEMTRPEMNTNAMVRISSTDMVRMEDIVVIPTDFSKDMQTSGKMISSASSLVRYKRRIPLDKLILARQYYKIFSFFDGSSGSMDVWENVIAILCNKKEQGAQDNSVSPFISAKFGLLRPSDFRIILPENEIFQNARTFAVSTEANCKQLTKKTSHNNKLDEQLRQSAMMYARMGEFQNYCKIMVDLGDWTAALAMAPSVSMDYWKSLVTTYTLYLASHSSEQCVPYLVGIGKDADAVEFYLNRKDTKNAMIVAKMSEQRQDIIPDHVLSISNLPTPSALNLMKQLRIKTTGVEEDGKTYDGFNVTKERLELSNTNTPRELRSTFITSPKNSIRERTEGEMNNSRLIVRSVAQAAANMYLASAQPLLAAAQYLSVEDVSSAVQVLVNNYEYDMAYAVAHCFELDLKPYIVLMADVCASSHAVDLALDMLEQVDGAEMEMALLLSRYCTESKTRKLLNQRGLRSMHFFLNKAVEEETIGSDADAVCYFAIGRNYTKSVTIGLQVLRKFIRDSLDLSQNTRKLLKGLKYIKARELEETLRITFLCYLLWFTAHESVIMGMWENGCYMLKILLDNMGRIQFPISEKDVQYQLLFFKICCGESTAMGLLQSMLKDFPSQSNGHENSLKEGLQILAGLMNDTSGGLVRPSHPSTPMKAVRPSSENLAIGFISSRWGQNAVFIQREIERLSDSLSLPSLTSKVLAKRQQRQVGGSNLSDLDKLSSSTNEFNTNCIAQGSILPVANQQLKSHVSFISGKPIQGAFIQLNGQDAYITINEAINWRKTNPFSPLMNGDLLIIY